jgi:hypothetical protein
MAEKDLERAFGKEKGEESSLVNTMFTMGMFIIALAILVPVLTTRAVQAYQGKIISVVLSASAVLKSLNLINVYNTPWVTANFINDGPNLVEIAINYPDNKFTIGAGESAVVDRQGAAERIAIIFYQCPVGTASVRVTGEY